VEAAWLRQALSLLVPFFSEIAMPAVDKSALRAAVLIHEHVAVPYPPRRPIHLSDYHWNEAQRLVRQIELAYRRGWRRAVESLNTDLTQMLTNFQRELGWAITGLRDRKTPPRIATVADMYHDILALHDEFDHVAINVKEHTLRVTTDRVVLDDVRLGRFEIVLDWRDLGKHPPYRVVALDPNPAAADSEVTHPHVRNEGLCEGEGIRPIAAALAEGRLLDFFNLVSQILHNYGRGSGYVELDDWEGVSCEDCGCTTRPDERYCCNRCGITLCESCDIYCEHCHESYCSGCMGTCAGCQHEVCSYCLAECPKCKRSFCKNCRKQEGNLCHECFENQQPAKEKPDVPQPHETQEQPPRQSRSGRRRQAACTAAP
jgi:hypothetical protein